jgi:acetyl esterase/lipase
MMRFAAPVSLMFALSIAAGAIAADNPKVLELWPGTAPDEPGNIGPEKVHMSKILDRKQVEITEPTRLLTNVTKPTITIYRPAKDKDTGTAVLICPGGGYWDLYWQLEGEEVAAWLNSLGVTGIILKYRVPRRPDEPKGEPAAIWPLRLRPVSRSELTRPSTKSTKSAAGRTLPSWPIRVT